MYRTRTLVHFFFFSPSREIVHLHREAQIKRISSDQDAYHQQVHLSWAKKTDWCRKRHINSVGLCFRKWYSPSGLSDAQAKTYSEERDSFVPLCTAKHVIVTQLLLNGSHYLTLLRFPSRNVVINSNMSPGYKSSLGLNCICLWGIVQIKGTCHVLQQWVFALCSQQNWQEGLAWCFCCFVTCFSTLPRVGSEGKSTIKHLKPFTLSHFMCLRRIG